MTLQVSGFWNSLEPLIEPTAEEAERKQAKNREARSARGKSYDLSEEG
jgi:hypothetical protein